MAFKMLLTIIIWLAANVAAVQYDQYILAPRSRTILPVSVHRTNGSVTGAESLLQNGQGTASLPGQSAVTYDFGKNIAGVASINFGNVSPNSSVAVTFSESSLWVSGVGSDGTADAGIDEALLFSPTGPGVVSAAREHERGGFRYLSLINNGTSGQNVEINNLTVHFTAMPHWKDDQLTNYTGYFHSDDELLNRIWYAGAYTNQLCTIDPHNGNALVHLGQINSTQSGDSVAPLTWYNNYTIANSSSVLTDGAKRDRLVWAGDMAIAVPALVVSTNDLISVANSLDSLFDVRNTTTGQLPYAGVPFPLTYSATYHMYSLIGVADYYLYSGDLNYLQQKWSAWKQGLAFSLSFIDSSGMMNVTSPTDWLRSGMGGHNIEANSILYYTINQGIMLGKAVNESAPLLQGWTTIAETIKTAANTLLWSPEQNLYTDNDTTTLCPQDGNAWSILANLTSNPSRASLISQSLSSRWGKYGAPAPEANDPKFPSLQTISPFIGGFELQSHFLSSQPSRAIELIRRQWGFMLEDPRMTNSTFIEGYSSDGSLHYAPYTNDPRVSHAHGWATGPTSVMTMYLAGLRVTRAGGAEWEVGPQLGGGLRRVEAGYETARGSFSVVVQGDDAGRITALSFETPGGTMGRVVLGQVVGSIQRESDGQTVPLNNGTAENVEGGKWKLVTSSPTTNGGVKSSPFPLLSLLVTFLAFLV